MSPAVPQRIRAGAPSGTVTASTQLSVLVSAPSTIAMLTFSAAIVRPEPIACGNRIVSASSAHALINRPVECARASTLHNSIAAFGGGWPR